MKKYLPLLFITVTLIGCESVYLPSLKEVSVRSISVKQDDAASKTPADRVGRSNFHLVSNRWPDVSKVRGEATHLNYQVSQGKMTKVQAAQYLNRLRIQLVGRDSVSDSMCEACLRSAVDSQCGEISTSQSKLYIQSVLRGWQQHWKSITNKSSNPAFTNSLVEVVSMMPLQ